jgi:diguanylate cyclase (GGDEF)-like protein
VAAVSFPVAPGPAVVDASADDVPRLDDLAASVTALVTVTARTARLTTLDLRVTGRPELAVLARGGAAGSLVAWSVQVPADRWQAGLVLVATAAGGDAPRVAAVEGAAALLHDLLRADGRRVEAEQRAVRVQRAPGVDLLTGLGDRSTWEGTLAVESARAARYGRPACVVVVDLDDLASINDGRGRAEGDRHLQRAAAALTRASRTVDTVCRLGGDEFAVLGPETGPDGALGLVGRLSAGLAAAGVEASLGMATTKDGNLDLAWRSAELRMHEDKRQRQGRR